MHIRCVYVLYVEVRNWHWVYFCLSFCTVLFEIPTESRPWVADHQGPQNPRIHLSSLSWHWGSYRPMALHRTFILVLGIQTQVFILKPCVFYHPTESSPQPCFFLFYFILISLLFNGISKIVKLEFLMWRLTSKSTHTGIPAHQVLLGISVVCVQGCIHRKQCSLKRMDCCPFFPTNPEEIYSSYSVSPKKGDKRCLVSSTQEWSNGTIVFN